MPQTIVVTQSFSKPRKCDVPGSNFVTLDDESPTGSDSSLDDLFINGQSSKKSPRDGRETEGDKGIRSLSVFTNEVICNRRNEELDFNHLNGTYSDCTGVNGGLINFFEDKKIRCSDGEKSSLPKKPLNHNMKIINESDSEILGDFSDLLSSITPTDKVSNDVSSESTTCWNGFQVPMSNGSDFKFFKSRPVISNGSLKCEDSNSEDNGTLSDILSSISFEENNSTRNGFKSSESNLFFEDFQVPSLNGLDSELSRVDTNCPADNLKLSDFELPINSSLSDYFLSIDIKEDEPMKSKLNSSLPPSDSYLSFEDIRSRGYKEPVLESSHLSNGISGHKSQNTIFSPDSDLRLEDNKVPNLNEINSNSELQNNTLSDILSTILPLTDNCTVNTPIAINGVSKPNDQLSSWVDFNVDNRRVPTSSICIPKPTGKQSTTHNQKNGEFSFFSVSPENMFSDLVSKFKMDEDLQDNTTNGNSAGISMLDLFKSVNSDSSSSLSEYLSSESDGSFSDKNTTEAAHEMLDIDLSSCVKISDDTLTNTSTEKYVFEDGADTRENDCSKLQLGGFGIKAFEETDCSKRPRMNLKQGLFAKSLSCKPKKNPVLLQKVARIKSELFEKYFNCPYPKLTAKSIQDSIVNQSNNCMITFNGRRVCTSTGLEGVKCI